MLRKISFLSLCFSLLISFSWQISATSECSPYSFSGLDGKIASKVKLQFIKTSNDIQRLREIMSHPEMGSLYTDGKITPDKIEKTVTEHINGVLPDEYNSISGYFGVYISNELVGIASLRHFPEEDAASVYYAIAYQHRGKGLATESVKVLSQFAFEALQVNYVFAVIDRSNEASIRVAQKIGFIRDKEEYEELSQTLDYYTLTRKNLIK